MNCVLCGKSVLQMRSGTSEPRAGKEVFSPITKKYMAIHYVCQNAAALALGQSKSHNTSIIP
jgi:hypothetical protein